MQSNIIYGLVMQTPLWLTTVYDLGMVCSWVVETNFVYVFSDGRLKLLYLYSYIHLSSQYRKCLIYELKYELIGTNITNRWNTYPFYS